MRGLIKGRTNMKEQLPAGAGYTILIKILINTSNKLYTIIPEGLFFKSAVRKRNIPAACTHIYAYL